MKIYHFGFGRGILQPGSAVAGGLMRPLLQSGVTARSSKELPAQHGQSFRTTLCNKVDPISLSYSRGSLQGGAHRFLAKASSGTRGRRGAIVRSPIVAESSGIRSTGSGGTVVTQDTAVLSTMDESPGSRASYTTDTDSEGEGDYSLAFDNESMPGSTVVGIDGMDQDNLLMDVTLSFYEMGISVQSAQVLTRNDRVVDVFIVTDAETKSAIPEDRWPEIKEKIFAKLKRRNVLNTATGDPKLAEQGAFLTQTLNKAVRGDGREDVLEAAFFLQNGFEGLRRKEDPRKRADLLRYIENMDQRMMTAVIRLFYLYSSLLNVADEARSHRLRREQVWASRNATPLWYASFDQSLRTFKKENVGAAELQELLNRTEYNPVFTAHPTEARRREVLTCLHRIFILCNDREDPRLSPAQKAELEVEIEAEVEILWRTDEMRATKPTVLEEIVTGLDYFRYSLFEAVCTTYRYAENSVDAIYPGEGVVVPSILKFGSWIGGDRDGNPFVRPETTVMAALLASRLILAEYIRRVRACQDTLTHSLLICEVSPELIDSLVEDRKVMEKIPAILFNAALFEQEPYRLKLRVMRHRLEQRLRVVNARLRELGKAGMHDELLIDIEFNIDEIPGLDPKEDAYIDEEQFLGDLKLIDFSLRKGGDVRLADRKLKDLIRLAETFGFYCCALDVRQESTVHSEATNEIMRLLGLHDNYSSLSESERMKLLAEVISSPPPVEKVEKLYETMSESSKEVVELFFAMADIVDNISKKSIASYVISMTRQASHVMEVLFLGWFSCKNLLEKKLSGEWNAQLVVAPLFETIPDLENMPGSLESLFKNETYKAILMASGGVQEIMLGYSDSCKDGGITASAYNLYKAQYVIQQLTAEAGIKSCIFHGRGGTVGRGAGPTHESILSQPPGSVDGQIKFTEQGEVITYRYGNAQTAAYELTVGITGLLKASHPATRERGNYEKYFPIMEQLATAAEKSYRDLTDETEGFYDYFYEATVVSEIGLINIGSRPARRKAGVRDKSSLRAIPWVFGWAQSRHTLPAWYGVGSGIASYTRDEPDRIKELQTMYLEWPFFRTFLSNVQMSLFKASMEIAQEYARLCSNRITQKLVFDLVAQEYYLTKAQFLMVSQQNNLLQDNPSLRSSFDTRRKYLDPLNHLQVILLGRQRDPTASEEQKPLWEKPLLRSIKAIASNMRNTG